MSAPSKAPLPPRWEFRNRIYQAYVTEKTSVEGTAGSTSGHAGYRIAEEWLPADTSVPVLEIGCGPGEFLRRLSERGFTNLLGVDLSREQLDIARRTCPSAELVLGDARELLRANPERFGLILAFDVLEHFRKDELLPLVEEIARAIHPGGRLIVQAPNAESPWGMMVRYGDLTHELAFDTRSLRHLLRMGGLRDFAARECGPYVHGVRSAARVLAWAAIRQLLRLWNVAETGTAGSGIYTRVFLATAIKPA